VPIFSSFRNGPELVQGLCSFKEVKLMCKAPDNQLDSFEGNIVLQNKEETDKIPVDSKQLLLRVTSPKYRYSHSRAPF
jgi:hypothetical protein